jgi:predicted transcriptional regulator of viral defense system
MDVMKEIRKRAQAEEIDYLFLMDCLSAYKQPRDKLTNLLKSGQIIRVKKGIYVFGKEYRRRPYSLEVLSNLIYGPSYVSFEYALSYYNLIPEKVMRITCASNKRIKHFSTPVGEFVYHYLASEKFASGVTWERVDEKTHFLIATREKALADYVARMKPFTSREDLRQYLIEGMRIDPRDLFSFRKKLVKEIASVYQNKNVDLLWNVLER